MSRRRKKLNDQHAIHDLFLQDDLKAEEARLIAQRREEQGNPIADMMAQLEQMKRETGRAVEREV